ncbi:hypothetical protein [Amycolatopsis jiangsuensis]|uniref:Uncharacterized protein n=1 Tax=Amycolatopsis jiangsuensis TaxID=1181879 RepID=A0A840IXR6_9PSEU|nr:hypothetical protein [Amycolatopsis jiangsuensis]MBB4686299.1 hypothetical protein [Amycolatopsis jiangsuensis]
MKLKTGIWLIAVTTVVIVAAAVIVFVRQGSTADTAQAADPNADNQTIQRAGYPNSQYADPAPIKEKPNPQAVQYAGKPVIQACTLLSVGDLTALGMKVGSRPDPNVVNFDRSYLVGDGSGPLTSSSISLPDADGLALNKCSYELNTTDGTTGDLLSVAVAQPGYQQDLDLKLFRESPNARFTVGPVKAFWKDTLANVPAGEAGEAALVAGDTYVDFHAQSKGTATAGKLPELVKRMAQHLATQTATPTGPVIVDYDSPVFRKSVAQPCPMLTADVVSPAIGTEASPLVEEMPGTAVGNLIMGDASAHNYVELSCERGTGQDDPLSRIALTLTAYSFLSDDAAKAYVDSAPANGQSSPATVGDKARILSDASGQTKGQLVFAKGRFAFTLYLADHAGHPDGVSAADVSRLLVPAARKMLADFHQQ